MAKLRGGGGLSSFKMFNRGVIQYINMFKEGGYTIFKYKTEVCFINTIIKHIMS